MNGLIKLMFFFWGLVGMALHSILAVDRPGIKEILEFYQKNSKGLIVSFLCYVCLYGIWAGMSRWAPVLGWVKFEEAANPWFGVFAVVIGYAGDSLWPKLVNKVVKKVDTATDGV
jgi:hypothetical protein